MMTRVFQGTIRVLQTANNNFRESRPAAREYGSHAKAKFFDPESRELISQSRESMSSATLTSMTVQETAHNFVPFDELVRRLFFSSEVGLASLGGSSIDHNNFDLPR